MSRCTLARCKGKAGKNHVDVKVTTLEGVLNMDLASFSASSEKLERLFKQLPHDFGAQTSTMHRILARIKVGHRAGSSGCCSHDMHTSDLMLCCDEKRQSHGQKSVCTNACMDAFMHVCMYVRMNVTVCTYVRACVRARVCVCVCACVGGSINLGRWAEVPSDHMICHRIHGALHCCLLPLLATVRPLDSMNDGTSQLSSNTRAGFMPQLPATFVSGSFTSNILPHAGGQRICGLQFAGKMRAVFSAIYGFPDNDS